MSSFKDITITGVGIPLLEGYRFYPLTFKLSHQPDLKWIVCLRDSYIQSFAQLLDNEIHRATTKEKAEFIFQTFLGTGVGRVPDDEKEVLNAVLGQKDERLDLFEETASIIAPYLKNKDELVFPWLERRDSKDGWEIALRFIPYVKQWIEAANDCRQKNKP
jgi:hypothetical protein